MKKMNFRKDPETGSIHVDGVAECGRPFDDCAVVLNPLSRNPSLLLERPLGVKAVKEILDYIDFLGRTN